MPVVHSFDPPERFVAGTVGMPGERTFFVQAREGSRVVSVALEKQQVAALAERLEELLDDLMAGQGASAAIPALTPAGLEDSAPLEQPVEEEFRAGTMTLSWDPDDGRVVIAIYPYSEAAVVAPDQVGEEHEEPEPEEVFLVRVAPGMARAFAARAGKVVEAGRPDCPFCAQPIDPAGHLCVRANGFKRRDP